MTQAVAAIVPAAGIGRRLGGSVSKLFLPLNGRPLLAHTLRVLQASPRIRWIVLVVRARERTEIARMLARERVTKAVLCLGGSSRAESVARGFAVLPAEARWVLVHDGARPCLTESLIRRAVAAARQVGAAVCGLPASLTVKKVDGHGRVRSTLDRERLWFAQTPQVFRRDWFARALTRVNGRLERFPDDVSVLEAAGYRVHVVPGDPLNIKVTTREDLLLAEAILKGRLSGQVTRWPSDRSLAGHRATRPLGH